MFDRPVAVLTSSTATKTFTTAQSSNAFQIFWETLEDDVAVAGTGVTLAFSLVLPAGTEIPFDNSPYQANVNTIPATNAFGGITVKVVATGLAANQEVKVYADGMF